MNYVYIIIIVGVIVALHEIAVYKKWEKVAFVSNLLAGVVSIVIIILLFLGMLR
jgi:hypothetical protein